MRDPVTSASLPFSTTCRTTMSQHSSGSQHKAVTEDERLLASPSRERRAFTKTDSRSEEHTSELQSQSNLVCRLLLEKKKKKKMDQHPTKNCTDAITPHYT